MSRRTNLQLALLLAVALALGTARKASSLGSPDFRVFHAAARHALEDPENIYRLSPDRYLYPPSTALLLVPFAFGESYGPQRWAWHGLLAGLTFALAAPGAAALAAMLLLARYLAITFGYGQINLVVLALLTACGWAAGRGSLRAAGMVWALATSLKVYPAVLAPFFLARERRRAWGGALLVSALLIFLPFACFGLEAGSRLYSDFLAALLAKGLPLHSHNQSLAALLLRLGTPQDFYLHSVGTTSWGLADLPVPLLRAAALALGGGLSFLSWRRAWGRGPAAALSASAFCILFLSHIVWKDYMLFLYFPLREGFSAWSQRKSFLVGGLFAALVTFSSPDLVGHAVSTRLDAAGVHLWAAGLLWWAWWR